MNRAIAPGGPAAARRVAGSLRGIPRPAHHGPGEVRHVLGILGLDSVLDLYHRLDRALAAEERAPA